MGKPSKADPGQRPKPKFLVDVLREAVLKEGVGTKEGVRYVFRGLGKVEGAYPHADTPQAFLSSSALRGKALQVIRAHADRHSISGVAKAFCPKALGKHFPDHTSFDEETRAAAVVAHVIFHPNEVPVPA